MKKYIKSSYLFILLIVFYTCQSSLAFSQEKSNYSLVLKDSIQKEFVGYAKQLEINGYTFKGGVMSHGASNNSTISLFDLSFIGDTSIYSSIPSDQLQNKLPILSTLNPYVENNGKILAYEKFIINYSNGIIDFDITAILYENKFLINKAEYCKMYHEISSKNQRNIDSVMQHLLTIYPLKYYDTISWSDDYKSYELRFKEYLPRETYNIEYEFVPEDDVEAKKTTMNAMLDHNELVPLSKCNCEDLDPVLLIFGGERTLNQKKVKLNQGNFRDKYNSPLDITYQIQYLMIRLTDYKIIQYGITSGVSPFYSKNAIH